MAGWPLPYSSSLPLPLRRQPSADAACLRPPFGSLTATPLFVSTPAATRQQQRRRWYCRIGDLMEVEEMEKEIWV
uniref:Uncharacterized protein n=1 Tax=Oryza sativa subsp. japonica TaxID=39947 RepID=Q69SZ6_ORYSJ|nr:hypothetical protein [Oryza sativa Japonica Group]